MLFISRIVDKGDNNFIMFTTNCWPICVQAERRKLHITSSPLRAEFQKAGGVEADRSTGFFFFFNQPKKDSRYKYLFGLWSFNSSLAILQNMII